MATRQMSEVIQCLRRVLRDGAGPTDEQLLEDYISRRDEAAVAAIVGRHGPMVWGVCRRVLNNHHDAEDAFQATFLVLVRRAASIASRELLANWLYGVAYQTALKARATAIKRKGRERQVANMPEPLDRSQGAGIRSQGSGVREQEWLEVQGLLDQELSRLPDIYRGVIVHCVLEGKTRSEAARHWGLPEGTVASRLARARTMLAKRLAKRGVVLSGGTLAAVLAQNVASAGMPASVVTSTISAARLVAAGQLAAGGSVSVKVAALAEGVLKAMMIAKLKAALAVVLVFGFVITGATMLTSSLAMVQAKQPAAAVGPAQEPPKQDKERFTAWGKEVGGLQAGLGFPAGQRRAYAPGETVKLVVRVRNIGKDEVKFRYSKESFFETPPSVTDGEGKPVPLKRRIASGFVALLETTLAPGKEIELAEVKLEPRTATQSVHEGQWNLFTTGKFSVWYDQLADPANDKTLSKIATGKLDLEIKFTATPENDKQAADPEKLYRTMEKTVRAAKSLHVALDSDVDSQTMKGTAKATIYAAQGNKSRLEIDFEMDGKADKLLFLTDGKAGYTKQGDNGTLVVNPKKAAEQAKLVPVMMARIGFTGARMLIAVKQGEEKEIDFDKDALVTNFKLGAKEMVGAKTAQVVTHQLDFDGTTAKMSVWIDTKTHLPLKRVLTAEQAGQMFRITETYSTFAIDPKLDAKLFEIPKE